MRYSSWATEPFNFGYKYIKQSGLDAELKRISTDADDYLSRLQKASFEIGQEIITIGSEELQGISYYSSSIGKLFNKVYVRWVTHVFKKISNNDPQVLQKMLDTLMLGVKEEMWDVLYVRRSW